MTRWIGVADPAVLTMDDRARRPRSSPATLPEETRRDTSVPATVMNPYSSPTTAESRSAMKPSPWLRRLIILNGTLLIIPLTCLMVAYAFIGLSTAWESATQQGDPIVYQHFFWLNVDPWFAIAYFLVPNGTIAALFARWRFRSTKRNQNNDAVA